ncbi:hypothetical protein G6F56_011992 [Rhizopus delemar]|nr:hypothetical protein G6F56_011992 [Rhizopus delemar]
MMRVSRHLQRVIREDPFAPYAQLQTELNAMDIMVSRQTVIACLKGLGFGSLQSIWSAHWRSVFDNAVTTSTIITHAAVKAITRLDSILHCDLY